jgi:hypothetical protein
MSKKNNSEKVIRYPNYICLYCGKDKEEKWDDHESYHECDCDDAKEVRRIDEEIRRLEQQKPQYKYRLDKQIVLNKIN